MPNDRETGRILRAAMARAKSMTPEAYAKNFDELVASSRGDGPGAPFLIEHVDVLNPRGPMLRRPGSRHILDKTTITIYAPLAPLAEIPIDDVWCVWVDAYASEGSKIILRVRGGFDGQGMYVPRWLPRAWFGP